MTYVLPNGPSPDLVMLIDAIYAEPLHDLATNGQRIAEMTDGSSAALAVVRSGSIHVGSFNVATHEASNLTAVREYGRALRLEEQIAVYSAFRKTVTGPIRRLLGDIAESMGSQRAILVICDHGVAAIVPEDGTGVHRLVALKLDGARTIAQERLCVEVARESLSTWELIWHAVQEHRRATEPVETDPYDVLEGPAPRQRAAVRISEEDAIDGLEDSYMADLEPSGEGEEEPSEPDEENTIGSTEGDDIYDADDEIRF